MAGAVASTDLGGTLLRTGGRAWVELLHLEGCPLAPAAHRLVRQCLIALGISDPVLVRVGDGPSPTVLVNGTDVMRPAELSIARVCRIDVPTRKRVLAALRAARAAESRGESFHRDQPLDPPVQGRVYAS